MKTAAMTIITIITIIITTITTTITSRTNWTTLSHPAMSAYYNSSFVSGTQSRRSQQTS